MTEEQALKVHSNLDIYTSSFRFMLLFAAGHTEEQALAAHPNLDIYTSSFRAMLLFAAGHD